MALSSAVAYNGSMTKSLYEPPLPTIAPQRGASGFLLIDKSDGKTAVYLVFFSAFWLALSTFAFAMAVTTGAELIAKIFSGLFVAIGLLLVAFTIKRINVARKLAPPTLELAQWPVRLGGRCKVRFERRTKDGTRFDSVQGTFVLVESATYRVGTDTRTVTKDVWSMPLVPRAGQGETVRAEWELEPPVDAPSSFEAPRNRLRWEVRILSAYQGGQDDSSFEVLVLPEGIAWPAA